MNSKSFSNYHSIILKWVSHRQAGLALPPISGYVLAGPTTISDYMSDLLQNHMSTIQTIKVHAQEVWDKSNKD